MSKAAVVQMTYPGTPFLYYGAEAGMWGANDPDCRKPMVWPDIAYEPESHGPNGERSEPQEVKFDEAIHQFYRAAISMRRSHPALSFGSMRWLKVDDGQNSVVFVRETPEQKILVVLNRHDQPQTLRFPYPEGWNAESSTAFFTSDGSTATLKKVGGELEAQIPSLTAAVFKP